MLCCTIQRPVPRLRCTVRRRWDALETALQGVVDTAGSMAAFRRRYAAGTWWWLSTAGGGMVPAGPDRFQTCRKARRAGLIDQ